MLSLLKNCPQEVAQLRRELLIAARHILSTDLRNRFIPCINQLFDEDLLIGSAWTTREVVRYNAYNTLVDLVHHIRGHLSLAQLSLAVQLFSKNVHDNTLPVNIQNMACKLLLNLVESIRQKTEQEPAVSYSDSHSSVLVPILIHVPKSVLAFNIGPVSILISACKYNSHSWFQCVYRVVKF